MAEIQAAVLRLKLTRLTAWTESRQRLAKIYDKGLADSPVVPPSILQGNNHTYHQYTVRSTRRDQLQAFLKEREIDSMIYYPVPLHYHAGLLRG
jgi:dTDP-4-amino-4,6-dideoxygalactose transaminase